MSSQSLGRSNIALQTARCSGERIGIVVSANGTSRAALEGGDVDSDIDPERGEGVANLRPALGRDEDVDVDVDRGPRLGVVGEGEGAADRVRDAGGAQRRVDRDHLLRQRGGASPRRAGLAPIHPVAARAASDIGGSCSPLRSPESRASSSSRRNSGSSGSPPARSRRASRAARSTGVPGTGAPARAAARRSSSALIGCAARTRAFWMTSSVISLKLARVRLRGAPGGAVGFPDLVRTSLGRHHESHSG